MAAKKRELIRYTHDGGKQLVCAILFSAVDAWRKHGLIDVLRAKALLGPLQKEKRSAARDHCLLAREMGFGSPQEEMLAFFREPWFHVLCGIADVPAKAILKKLSLSL